MTRDEAIKVLSSYDVNGVWADVDGKPYNAEEQAEAFDTAIEALKSESIFTADRPRGEWVAEEEYGDLWVCDQCGFASEYKDNFCSNCGADMRGDDK